MENAAFYFQHPWLVALAFGAGLLYAGLLYWPKQEWSAVYKYGLAAVRFTVIFIIVLLLAGPISRYFERNTEKPQMIIALDQSYSIKAFNDSSSLNTTYQQLQTLQDALGKKGITVKVVDLNGTESKLVQPRQWTKQTSISQLMANVKDLEENKNFKGLILATDGIYNKGINPLYQAFNTPVYTIGLGDTTVQRDVKIKNILYNKISYKGNEFPIHVDVASQGTRGEAATVFLKNKGQVLSSQKITLRDKGLQRVSFQTSAKEKGLLHLTVEVSVVTGEKNTANNKAHAYIEVIDNKQKILICAAAPHPDIKAIRTALDKKENVETSLCIPGISPLAKASYDLIIFHQLPHMNNLAQNEFHELMKTSAPKLFIVGNLTNLPLFNQANNLITIIQRSGQKDLAAAVVNPNFTKFSLPADQKERWNETPPLQVPFGDYKIKSEADIILYQKIGKVNTNNPLLLASSDRKTAVFCGEGLWWWRLNEAAKFGEADAFDKLVHDLVQFMSSKEDKRKFKVYPLSNEFIAGDNAVFQAELYNDIYEPVYDVPFQIKLTDENKDHFDYSFVHTKSNQGYNIAGLKPGVYQFTATGELNGKKEHYSGEFLMIEELSELMESTANHNLLRELSAQTKGKFYKPAQLNQLTADLTVQDYPDVLHASESLVHWIQLTWILWLLIILASIEWTLRKYKGIY
ncbi:MAG TPA: hypothetical protein VK750_02575 [Cytophagaceae bacterium]|jgi:hypothetical protein|nr:hypothetical protein [Cytophagaceae bacterium]